MDTRTDRENWHWEQTQKNKALWSSDETAALQRYTLNDFEQINGFLWGHTAVDERTQQKIECDVVLLDQAIEKYELPVSITVFRGFQVGLTISQGDVIQFAGFTSTSIDRSEAETFALSLGKLGVLLQATIPEGTPVAFPFWNHEELEVLLGRGIQMRIKSIARRIDKSYTEIIAEVVDHEE